MNGRALALGSVAALAAGSLLRARGSFAHDFDIDPDEETPKDRAYASLVARRRAGCRGRVLHAGPGTPAAAHPHRHRRWGRGSRRLDQLDGNLLALGAVGTIALGAAARSRAGSFSWRDDLHDPRGVLENPRDPGSTGRVERKIRKTG